MAAPTRRSRNGAIPWLFRCRPNDSYSATIIAEFGFGTLQKQKWAVVFATDAFGTNGSKALEAALKERSMTPVLMQGYANQASDYAAIVEAVRQSGADVLGSYCMFEGDLAVFAKQLRQSGITIPWIGSASLVTATALNVAGEALFGTYGVSDCAMEGISMSEVFGTKYRSLHNALPDFQASYTHDAVLLLARAITDAGGTDPDKLRAALTAIRGFAGAEGEYNFDDKGHGLRGYNIVKNENGKIVFDRRIEVEPT